VSRFDEILDRTLGAFRFVSEALLGQLDEYMEPYASALPDARFSEGLFLLAAGMLAARSPQVSKAAAHAPQDEQEATSLLKRFYRLLKTSRFKHRRWLKVLYADARQVVEAHDKERVVVALDPVNFEKAYAEKIEGISTVRKSTPPGTLPKQEARLTQGYPALMAYIVNLPQPAIPYARLFSYTMPEFLSENREIERAMRTNAAQCVITEDVNPPVYRLALGLWMRLFGPKVFSVRLFSAVLGWLAVPLAWWLGKKLLGPLEATLAASMMALSPFQVYYSREAKGYILVNLLALLSVIVWLRLVRLLPSRRKNAPPPSWLWPVHALITAAMLGAHYFSALLVVWQNLWTWGRLRSQRRDLTLWIGSQGLAAVALLAWLWLTLPGLLDGLHHTSTKEGVQALGFLAYFRRVFLEFGAGPDAPSMAGLWAALGKSVKSWTTSTPVSTSTAWLTPCLEQPSRPRPGPESGPRNSSRVM